MKRRFYLLMIIALALLLTSFANSRQFQLYGMASGGGGFRTSPPSAIEDSLGVSDGTMRSSHFILEGGFRGWLEPQPPLMVPFSER